MTDAVHRIKARITVLLRLYVALIGFGLLLLAAVDAAQRGAWSVALWVPGVALAAAWLAEPLYAFVTGRDRQEQHQRTGDWSATSIEELHRPRRGALSRRV